MSEDEAKAAERRAAHRAQLRAALPAGYQAPAPPSPFGPARSWKWQDSFTPQGLAAAGGEGARFFGSKVFEPMARGARQAFDVAADGFNDWNANRIARDERERALSDRYMPQIRAANANTERFMAQERALRGREDQALSRMSAALDPMREQWAPGQRTAAPLVTRPLDPGYGAPSRNPAELSDDELMAELASLEGGRQ